MNALQSIWKWVSKPTMNKLSAALCVVFLVLFLASFWGTSGELSYFPAAWLCSAGIITLVYLIDRVGFAKIDTIAHMQKNPDVYYKVVLPIYVAGIIIGHVLALLLAWL